MKKSYYIDIIFILILALAVSTVLPSYVSYKQEEMLLNQTVVEDLSTVRVNRTEKMEEKSPLEKFIFLLEEGIEYIEYVPVVEGTTLDNDEAEKKVTNELQELFDIGVLPSGELKVISGQLYTAANVNNPAQSLIVWQFLVMGAFEECYIVTMDDTAGKIISINAVWLQRNMEAFYGPAYESVAKMWGDYIGMSSMMVEDLKYTDNAADKVLDRAGNKLGTIMSMFGITDEEALKKFLADKGTAADAGSDAKARTGVISDTIITERKESIELSVVYYMEDGTAAQCIMDWDMHGYGFRRQEKVD